MDKIRHEDNPRNTHTHGNLEPSSVRHTQRPQYMEAVHQQRGAKGLWHLHVPD